MAVVDGFWIPGMEGTYIAMNKCLTLVGTAAEITATAAAAHKRCLAYATDTNRFYYSNGSTWVLTGIGTHTHASDGAEGGHSVDGVDVSAHVTSTYTHGATGPAKIAVVCGSAYLGDASTPNKAIPHQLGVVPKIVWLENDGASYSFTIVNRGDDARLICIQGAAWYGPTKMDATNFYVGDADDWFKSANAAMYYYWTAIG